jgi:hypothetical protein
MKKHPVSFSYGLRLLASRDPVCLSLDICIRVKLMILVPQDRHEIFFFFNYEPVVVGIVSFHMETPPTDEDGSTRLGGDAAPGRGTGETS